MQSEAELMNKQSKRFQAGGGLGSDGGSGQVVIAEQTTLRDDLLALDLNAGSAASADPRMATVEESRLSSYADSRLGTLAYSAERCECA